MRYNYNIEYWDCRTCHAKVNCQICEEKVTQALGKTGLVENLELRMVRKELSFEADPADFDDIEETLEECGVFLN